MHNLLNNYKFGYLVFLSFFERLLITVVGPAGGTAGGVSLNFPHAHHIHPHEGNFSSCFSKLKEASVLLQRSHENSCGKKESTTEQISKVNWTSAMPNVLIAFQDGSRNSQDISDVKRCDFISDRVLLNKF